MDELGVRIQKATEERWGIIRVRVSLKKKDQNKFITMRQIKPESVTKFPLKGKQIA